MGKEVPITKQTENAGLIALAAYANTLGWSWRPTPNDDYGFDGELEPVVDGEPTGKLIKVQVKSGGSYRKGETAVSFYYLASKDDLSYWGNSNVPVWLIVHAPDVERTYGIDVKKTLEVDPSIRRTRRIPFDKNLDLLAEKTEAKLLAAANDEECTGRIFRRPGGKYVETLFSNLLPALSLPARIYGAPTDCRTQADMRNKLGKMKKTPAILSEGMLWTFADLHDENCSLRAICNTAKISQWLLPDWLIGEDRRRLLVQLMNTCLRKNLTARGLVFDRDKNRFYFSPDNCGVRRLTYQSLQNRTTRPVVYPHVRSATNEVDYWVHWSARFRFLFFGNQFYLMVEPSMIFTKDGQALVAGEDMGRLATSRSSHQYNRNVLGFLFFWREYIREGKNQIILFGAMASSQKLAFSCDYAAATAVFGIDGDNVPVKELESDLDEIDLSLTEEDRDDVAEAEDGYAEESSEGDDEEAAASGDSE